MVDYLLNYSEFLKSQAQNETSDQFVEMTKCYAEIPPKEKLSGVLRKSLAQRIHELQLLTEGLLEKDFDKVSGKLSKIDEELTNPSLARNRLELLKDFAKKKTEEFQEASQRRYKLKMAS